MLIGSVLLLPIFCSDQQAAAQRREGQQMALAMWRLAATEALHGRAVQSRAMGLLPARHSDQNLHPQRKETPRIQNMQCMFTN
eukprot:769613-Amphidinium_carterae.1